MLHVQHAALPDALIHLHVQHQAARKTGDARLLRLDPVLDQADHLALEHALGFGRDRFAPVLFDQPLYTRGLRKVPMIGPDLGPEAEPAKVVRLHEASVLVARTELIEHAFHSVRGAVRCEAHGFAFAVADPPTEALGDQAIEPAERARGAFAVQEFELVGWAHAPDGE